MKIKNILLAIAVVCNVQIISALRYAGGDISLLTEYEEAGAVYKDEKGKVIKDLLPYMREAGMNAMRVRLFVDPSAFPNNDPNACQSLDYIIPICKRIVDNGFDLMLDFHYSDTWADPAAQWTPKAWEGLNDTQLVDKIYEYTKETLQTLAGEGIVPQYIQTGNEISYGMLWGKYGASASQLKKVYMNNPDNWSRLGKLLNSAIRACREECPEAKIIIHTERVAQTNVLNYFYGKMAEMNVDYDIIGLSYYPYFHGKMSVLNTALSQMEMNFPEKSIMVVETGYPYKWEVPGTNQSVDYAYSDAGQNQFATALVEALQKHKNVNGVFWWWPEYNAYGTSLSGWYNAPLFDSLTGKAGTALKTFSSYSDGETAGIEDVVVSPEEDDKVYDLQGRIITGTPTKGIYIKNGKKFIAN